MNHVKSLEDRLRDLERRIQELERRPQYIPYPVYPQQPSYNPNVYPV